MIEDHCNPYERINQFIDNDQLEITDILGIGAYGIVYAAKHVTTRKDYAVKCIIKANLDARQRKFQYTEINLHAKLSGHPNIIRLEKVIESDEMIDIILEYCYEGDLFSIITEKGGYIGNDYLIRTVFIQILDAVLFSHHHGIYHRDLKPENILVFDQGKTIKLADFGLATTELCSNDFGCGSTFYMSPECQGGFYKKLQIYETAPNDVWSLGIILINLTCGRNPWKQASIHDETFAAFIKNKDFLKKIFPITDELNDILLDIFALDPKKRISLCELRDRILNCTSFTVTNNNKYHDDEINKVIQEFEDDEEEELEEEYKYNREEAVGAEDEELNIVRSSDNYYDEEDRDNDSDSDNMTLPISSSSSDTAYSCYSFRQISKKSSFITSPDPNDDSNNYNNNDYYYNYNNNDDYSDDDNEYTHNDDYYDDDDDYDRCSVSTAGSFSSLSTLANSNHSLDKLHDDNKNNIKNNIKISLFSLTSYSDTEI